jgi:hypothetical protein
MEAVEERKYLLLPPEIEPKFLDYPACCLVTIIAELFWLPTKTFNRNLIPRSSFQLCLLPRKFCYLLGWRGDVKTDGLQMTELDVKIFGFYICDREIRSAANVAQW